MWLCVLQPVGYATCTRKMIFKLKKPTLLEVLQALRSLHTHSPPVFHDDPRLPNLILTFDRLLTRIDPLRCESCVVNSRFKPLEYKREFTGNRTLVTKWILLD